MNQAQALQVTKYLSEAYPRDEWSQERYMLWADAIADLDWGATYEAAKRWVKSEKWPPTVAELRERSEIAMDDIRRQSMHLLPPPESEPQLTPEQRAENIKRARELVEKLAQAKSLEEETG